LVFELGGGTREDIEVLEEFRGVDSSRLAVRIVVQDPKKALEVVKACEEAGFVLSDGEKVGGTTPNFSGVIRPGAYGALSKVQGVKAMKLVTAGRAS